MIYNDEHPISPIKAEDLWKLESRYNAVEPGPHASGSRMKTVTDGSGFIDYIQNDLLQAQHDGDLKPVVRGAGRGRDRR